MHSETKQEEETRDRNRISKEQNVPKLTKKKKLARKSTKLRPLPDFMIAFLSSPAFPATQEIRNYLNKVDLTETGWNPNVTKLLDFPKSNIKNILQTLKFDVDRKLTREQAQTLCSEKEKPIPKPKTPLPSSSSSSSSTSLVSSSSSNYTHRQKASTPPVPISHSEEMQPVQQRSQTSLGISVPAFKSKNIWVWPWEIADNKPKPLEKTTQPKEESQTETKLKETQHRLQKDSQSSPVATNGKWEMDEKERKEKEEKLKKLLERTECNMLKEFEYWNERLMDAKIHDSDSQCIVDLIHENLDMTWTSEELDAYRVIIPRDQKQLEREQFRLYQRIQELEVFTKEQVIKTKYEIAKAREAKFQLSVPLFSNYVQASTQKYAHFKALLSGLLAKSRKHLQPAAVPVPVPAPVSVAPTPAPVAPVAAPLAAPVTTLDPSPSPSQPIVVTNTDPSLAKPPSS